MKKNKVLSMIVTLTAILSGNSSFNNVGAKSSEIKNISSQKSVESVSKSNDKNNKKNKKSLEEMSEELVRGLKINLPDIVRYNIKVEVTDDNFYKFKYVSSWLTWPIDLSESLSDEKELTISSESSVEKVASKIVIAMLNYNIKSLDSDSILSKLRASINSWGKFSDVVDLWKKNGSYNSKIKEVGNEIIDKLIDKMRQAKDKKQKEVQEIKKANTELQTSENSKKQKSNGKVKNGEKK